MRWSYLSPDPAPKYAKEVQQATTLNDLLDVLQSWSDIAPDALACAAKMDLSDFLDFRVGLMKERRKQYAGDEWAARFMPILLPERMFTSSARISAFFEAGFVSPEETRGQRATTHRFHA